MLTAVIFPFDLFGNAGTGAGAQLLGDALREAIDDTDSEDHPTRSHAFAERLTIEEHPFDTLESVNAWRTTGREAARRRLKDSEFVLWLSGNHLGVLPVYEELGPDTLVIQFDAHLDCYALHDTHVTLSHGNFLLHAETPLPRIVNVGHRDLFLLPADIKKVFAATHSAEAVATDPARVLADIRKRAKRAKRVWIDIDVDVFDPAYCPGVCDPLPCGLGPMQMLPLLNAAFAGTVIGVSLSEFSPGHDERDRSLNLLGWFTEWLLLKAAERP